MFDPGFGGSVVVHRGRLCDLVQVAAQIGLFLYNRNLAVDVGGQRCTKESPFRYGGDFDGERKPRMLSYSFALSILQEWNADTWCSRSLFALDFALLVKREVRGWKRKRVKKKKW